MKMSVRQLVLGALFLALALLLPFLTGQIQLLGQQISPMHLPVLLCGFVCGWPIGALVGFIAPLLRSAMFGMPPMFPVAISMAFELCAYGLLTGLLYKLLPKTIPYLYLSLVLAMLGGRLVMGVANWLLLGGAYTWPMFLSAAFVKAVMAIVIQLALVPLVVMLLKRAKLMPNE